MQPFNTLGHLNLKVNDLQASIDFYTRIGFPEFLRLTEEDGTPWIVYMRITDELYIELLPGGTGSTISASPPAISRRRPPSCKSSAFR